jgi:hypothetical protein
MGDESCIYGYDPQTKQQSSQWKSPQSPRAKRARQVRSSTKCMLCVLFFYVEETVHCEFVPPNNIANSDFYCDVFRRLRENVQQKKTENLVQPQLAPSSRQCTHPHIPENHSL